MKTNDRMPSQTKDDPRSYVRRVQLPIPPHQGVKIQARSQEVYSATEPSREAIRHNNYIRRSDQLERQGFSAYNYKPYKGIGDPFYLDEKRLILSALGQLDDNGNDDSFSSSDDDSLYLDSRSSKRPQAPRRYVYKTRKSKNNLAKEVKMGREMMKNVRLGHGFFNLMEQQRQERMRARAEEARLNQERKMSNWQAPKSDSDSDHSDIEDFMKDAVPIRTSHSAMTGMSEIATPTPISSGWSPRSPRPQTGKKRCPSSRPYTPLHSSLLSHEPNAVEKSALFRQLCVLHWLLEGMNNEGNSPMAPIMTSWNMREIGGQKISPRKVVQDRTTENNWTTFQTTPVTLYPPVPAGKHASNVMFNVFSVTKKWGSNLRRTPRKISINPNQVPRPSISPQDPFAPRPSSGKLTFDGAIEKEADDEDINKNLFSFLDEYYMSLRKDDNTDETKDGADKEPESRLMTSASGERARRSRTPEERAERAARRAARRPDTGRDSNMNDSTQSWRTSSSVIRPKSSAALIEFQTNAQSSKYSSLSRDMQRDLSLVEEEKMADVEEALENWERTRIKTCRNKFSSLTTDCTTAQKALREMRHSTLVAKRIERRKYMTDHTSWYTELLTRLPDSVKNIWYFQEILEKLSTFVDGGKHSTIKFLKVLSTLREWEICAPDVCAALEFCREKIAELSVEDFEKWFGENFPNVQRPPVTPLATQVDHATRLSNQSAASTRSRPKTTGSIRSRTSCT